MSNIRTVLLIAIPQDFEAQVFTSQMPFPSPNQQHPPLHRHHIRLLNSSQNSTKYRAMQRVNVHQWNKYKKLC